VRRPTRRRNRFTIDKSIISLRVGASFPGWPYQRAMGPWRCAAVGPAVGRAAPGRPGSRPPGRVAGDRSGLVDLERPAGVAAVHRRDLRPAARPI